jgi:hypothetical protein
MKKYICKKNYVMDDERIAFKKGVIYEFDNDFTCLKNENNEKHYMIDYDDDFKEHFEPKQKKDKVVIQVLNKFKERSKIGIKKYGTTLHENNTDDFLNHLQEELMDAILYLQKLKNNGNK